METSFELKHETLYSAILYVDLYLSKINVRKQELQLIGAASIMLAAKLHVSIFLAYHIFCIKCDFRRNKSYFYKISFMPAMERTVEKISFKQNTNSCVLSIGI